MEASSDPPAARLPLSHTHTSNTLFLALLTQAPPAAAALDNDNSRVILVDLHFLFARQSGHVRLLIPTSRCSSTQDEAGLVSG